MADARASGSTCPRSWLLVAFLSVLASACLASESPRARQPSPSFRADAVRWLGRVDTSHPSSPAFSWSGSGFEVRFRGPRLTAELSNLDAYVFMLVLDAQPARTFVVRQGRQTYTLAHGLSPGEHTLQLVRQTEGQAGATTLFDVAAPQGELLPPGPALPRSIEVVGDSISCGYGNLGDSWACPFSLATESHYHTYAAIAARSLGAEISTVAVSGAGMLRNLDGSTVDTLPRLYDRAVTDNPRVLWVPQRAPDVIVINLGTNDIGGGDPGLPFQDVYLEFLARLRRESPNALLVVCLGPMLLDMPAGTGAMQLSDMRRHLQAVMRANAMDPRIVFLEFPRNGDADYGCDWHPNAKKHAEMAEQLVALLGARLGW
jgi:lysophospholipase L1-like esterase